MRLIFCKKIIKKQKSYIKCILGIKNLQLIKIYDIIDFSVQEIYRKTVKIFYIKQIQKRSVNIYFKQESKKLH